MAYRPGGNTGPSLPPTGKTLTGMVASYNRKGFGFIMCKECGDKSVFFSRESIHPQLQTSDLAGEQVTFELHRFPDGKLRANGIRPLGDVSAFKGASYGGSGRGTGYLANLNQGYASGSDNSAQGQEGWSHAQRTAFLRGLQGSQPPVAAGGPTRAFAAPNGFPAPGPNGFVDEDRSRDWKCESCGERNFAKRFECFKCKNTRPIQQPEPFIGGPAVGPVGPGPVAPPVRRAVSPHAGSRAVRESLMAEKIAGSPSESPSRKRSLSRSSSSSSSSDRKRKKKKRKKKSKGKKRKDSSSSDRSSAKSGGSSKSSSSRSRSAKGGKRSKGASEASVKGSPEVETAKSDALKQLVKLKEVKELDKRMQEWRKLLRAWHPDKNPERVEVATAVFQFLQKGKMILENA